MSAHDPKRTCSALVSLPTLRIFQRLAALIIRLFLLSQNSGQALLRSPKIGTEVEPSAEIELWNPEVLSSLSAPSAFKVASSSPATRILCNLRNALAHGGEIRQRSEMPSAAGWAKHLPLRSPRGHPTTGARRSAT